MFGRNFKIGFHFLIRIFLLTMIFLLTISCKDRVDKAEKIKGFNATGWKKGDFDGGEKYLQIIKDWGANAVSIVFTCYQDEITSTKIDCSGVDDEEIKRFIRKAKGMGFIIALKPHIDVKSGRWRGDIIPQDKWFEEYENFITKYAKIAEEEKVDIFIIGTEFKGTSTRQRWEEIVRKVKNEFRGKITYSANHSGEEIQINWWDKLDYIGISAYYPLIKDTRNKNPTIDEIMAGWDEHIKNLEELSAKFGRKIIFTEIGYRSVDGTSAEPWNWQMDGNFDEGEQADCYRAFFEKVWKKDFLEGVFFWNIDIGNPDKGGQGNKDYTPRGKEAEKVIKKYFSE